MSPQGQCWWYTSTGHGFRHVRGINLISATRSFTNNAVVWRGGEDGGSW